MIASLSRRRKNHHPSALLLLLLPAAAALLLLLAAMSAANRKTVLRVFKSIQKHEPIVVQTYYPGAEALLLETVETPPRDDGPVCLFVSVSCCMCCISLKNVLMIRVLHKFEVL